MYTIYIWIPTKIKRIKEVIRFWEAGAICIFEPPHISVYMWVAISQSIGNLSVATQLEKMTPHLLNPLIEYFLCHIIRQFSFVKTCQIVLPSDYTISFSNQQGSFLCTLIVVSFFYYVKLLTVRLNIFIRFSSILRYLIWQICTHNNVFWPYLTLLSSVIPLPVPLNSLLFPIIYSPILSFTFCSATTVPESSCVK